MIDQPIGGELAPGVGVRPGIARFCVGGAGGKVQDHARGQVQSQARVLGVHMSGKQQVGPLLQHGQESLPITQPARRMVHQHHQQRVFGLALDRFYDLASAERQVLRGIPAVITEQRRIQTHRNHRPRRLLKRRARPERRPRGKRRSTKSPRKSRKSRQLRPDVAHPLFATQVLIERTGSSAQGLMRTERRLSAGLGAIHVVVTRHHQDLFPPMRPPR